MSTPQEFQRVSAELTQLRAALAALADEWERYATGPLAPTGLGAGIYSSHIFEVRRLLERP